MSLLPISPLVATYWLQGLPALAGIDITQGLKDEKSWTSDFAIVVQVVPGVPDPYVPIRSVVFQIDVFGKAAAGSSRRPPWNLCYATAEAIREACYAGYARRIVIPGDYLPVRVTDVTCDREPYRLPADPSGLARVVMQIRMTYLVDQ